MKRLQTAIVALAIGGALGMVLSGCGTQTKEIPKEAFKQGSMPPEAQRGMAEAMKKVKAPPPH